MSLKTQIERIISRDKKLYKRRHGMRVDGKSVFLLQEVSHDQKNKKRRSKIRS